VDKKRAKIVIQHYEMYGLL